MLISTNHMDVLSRLALGLTLCAECLLTSNSASLNEDRFKADLLLVLAHPDDETVTSSYLARAIFDQHRRVAVVFATRRDSGVSNIWFLDAPDTPGQDVLRSLETWDHGRSLGRLVRYIRLTRPDVIVTWLPDYVAGENHGDHQAAGVLASEAFDVAADSTAYAEQVTAPRDTRNMGNLTEGLHPWQPKKLYFLTDAAHREFLKGRGPNYSSTEISPSKKVAYEQLGAEECAFHLTQSDSGYAAGIALQKHQVEKTYLHDPVQFIFGKSYVPGDPVSDLFEGITPGPAGYRAAPGFHGAHTSKPTFELGGPW
jgi:LmbE family N-acetylglucosaminyl deacetylase